MQTNRPPRPPTPRAGGGGGGGGEYMSPRPLKTPGDRGCT